MESNNQFGTHFEQVRPTCHLIPVVCDPEFKYSIEDFLTIITNIQAIENQANPQKAQEHSSVILDNPLAIKLTHHLFLVCLFFGDLIDSGFTIDNWPVASFNDTHLDAIKTSHVVQHLPAFDIRNDHIHPSEYEEKLARAIACVCFTMVHFCIKQKHVFNAIICDITVLCPPTSIISSSKSLKHILHPHLDSGKKTKVM